MDTTIRLKEDRPEPKDTSKRKLWLGSGLLIALLLFVTGGGGSAFYSHTYAGAQAAGDAIQRVAGDTLPFIASESGPKYRLQGIIYSSNNPMAVINRKSCAPGEKVSVKVGREAEVIECVDIEPEAVEIKTHAGSEARLTLNVRVEKTTP
jgi:hypothetical protein